MSLIVRALTSHEKVLYIITTENFTMRLNTGQSKVGAVVNESAGCEHYVLAHRITRHIRSNTEMVNNWHLFDNELEFFV